MTTAAQAIIKQALNLNPVERAEFIEELFRSFDKAPDIKIDALWADESEERTMLDKSRQSRQRRF
jgi:hypothetical protein